MHDVRCHDTNTNPKTAADGDIYNCVAGRSFDAVACHLKAVALAPEAGGAWDSLAMAATAAGHPELAEVADTRNLVEFERRFNSLAGSVNSRHVY